MHEQKLIIRFGFVTWLLGFAPRSRPPIWLVSLARVAGDSFAGTRSWRLPDDVLGLEGKQFRCRHHSSRARPKSDFDRALSHRPPWQQEKDQSHKRSESEQQPRDGSLRNQSIPSLDDSTVYPVYRTVMGSEHLRLVLMTNTVQAVAWIDV